MEEEPDRDRGPRKGPRHKSDTRTVSGGMRSTPLHEGVTLEEVLLTRTGCLSDGSLPHFTLGSGRCRFRISRTSYLPGYPLYQRSCPRTPDSHTTLDSPTTRSTHSLLTDGTFLHPLPYRPPHFDTSTDQHVFRNT